jgi:hypothetical protein
MQESRQNRYVGSLTIDSWKHKKTGKECVRVRLTMPNEILGNENFLLKPDRDVLINVREDGIVTLECL